MGVNYKNELQIDDPTAVKALVELFREIVKDEINKAQFNKMMIAKVVTANNGALTANIQLLNDGVTISNVKNRTGENLSTNDLVYVLFINGSSSNFVISLKC